MQATGSVQLPTMLLPVVAGGEAALRTENLIVAETRTVETLRIPSAPNDIRTFPSGDSAKKAESVDLTVIC